MTVRSFALAAVALVLLSAEPARADGVEGISLFPLGPRPRAGAELETGSFVIGGQRGSYASMVGRAEWQPTMRLGLRVRVPTYTLALANEPSSRTGVGDTELRTRVHLVTQEPLRVSVGCVMQLPTGSRFDGLGAGAVQLVPFVSAGLRPLSMLVLYLTVADALSMAGPHQLRPTNYVDPGTDHELRTTVGAIVNFTDKVSAQGILTATTLLVDVDRGRSLLTSALQLGTQPDPRLRLVLATQLPVAGEERFSWKLNAAATYAF